MFDGKADTLAFIGIQSPEPDSIFYPYSFAVCQEYAVWHGEDQLCVAKLYRHGLKAEESRQSARTRYTAYAHPISPGPTRCLYGF